MRNWDLNQNLLSFFSISILYLLALGCEDSFQDARSANIETDLSTYTFPIPNIGSESSMLDIEVSNTGAGDLRISGLRLEENDNSPEIAILDEGDWQSGRTTIKAGQSKIITLVWNILDAQEDSATLTISSNVGDKSVIVNTPDLDPEIQVQILSHDAEGMGASQRVILAETPAGGKERVEIKIQSLGRVDLSINELCLLGNDNQCVTSNQHQSFVICQGRPNTLSECTPLQVPGTLAFTASYSFSIFYAPALDQIDSEVGTLLVTSDAGTIPRYVLNIQGSPCVRSESTPICGGCGDGIVEGAEECDDGNLNEQDQCLNSCTLAICGDGLVYEGVEECDDQNQDDTDACLNRCQRAVCGDGIVQAGVEECDDGNEDDEDECLNTCTRAVCGDGVTQIGVEECDDGNMIDTDACLSQCVDAEVGDGIIEEGVEECDDGNLINEDHCTSFGLLARCGDGFLLLSDDSSTHQEECDDGNEDPGDGCDSNCSIERCGNGIIQVGEECDDGNTDNGDACLNSCISALCGDGFVYVGVEECDDTGESMTCDTDCSIAMCGDMFLNISAGEVCDAGHDDLTCDRDCSAVVCGDGLVNEAAGEVCDDGNRTLNDGCNDTCQIEEGFYCEGEVSVCESLCGDDIQASDEACDDGNTETEICPYGVDECIVCNANCELEAGLVTQCGDGLLNGLNDVETCDDGNRNHGDGCSDLCDIEDGWDCEQDPDSNLTVCHSICGDDIVVGDEACDDGNTETEVCLYGLRECQVCSQDCTFVNGAVAYCSDGVIQIEQQESCDDGNQNHLDGCSADCQIEPGWICQGTPTQCTSICGDDIVVGDEECDDGNTETEVCLHGLRACQVCSQDCTFVNGSVTYCGDGIIQIEQQESCDDGNDIAGDGCDSICEEEAGWSCQGEPSICSIVCGDQIIIEPETCDDGNTVTETCEYGEQACSVCNSLCQEVDGAVAYCGDEIVQAPESCDDGNLVNNDDCDNQCQTPVCGDSILAGDEACDDGNQDNTDACLNDCTLPSCRDGFTQIGVEECDDGNDVDDDECTNQCTLPVCGDGIINGVEECDDGDTINLNCEYNDVNCLVCTQNCERQAGIEIYCGDGVIQDEFEDCDGQRGCSATCRLPCSPNCPPIDWVEIQAGSFTMGTNFVTYSNSRPAHQVTIGYNYLISRSEVTVSEYQLCVDAEYCTAAGHGVDCNNGVNGLENHPVNCVTWNQMKTYATWLGADLPSEAEWEYAARGTANREYPWPFNDNNTPCVRAQMRSQDGFAGCGVGVDRSTEDVCFFVDGVTPEGACDMAGNVAEWTLDQFVSRFEGAPIDGSPRCIQNDCLGGGNRVTKGGHYNGRFLNIVTYDRIGQDVNFSSSAIGGRLVRIP